MGVILYSCLAYNHIASTVSSCMARLGQINQVKHAFDTTTLTIIINALIFSKLYYCCNVWSNTSKHNLSRIMLYKILQPVLLAVQRNFKLAAWERERSFHHYRKQVVRMRAKMVNASVLFTKSSMHQHFPWRSTCGLGSKTHHIGS